MTDRDDIKPMPTFGQHFRRALREANARRPASFYMLLGTPVVLLLAWGPLAQRERPLVFVIALSVLFVYFGFVLHRALVDVFEIARRQMNEHRDTFKETLGDSEFSSTLGRRVRENEGGE